MDSSATSSVISERLIRLSEILTSPQNVELSLIANAVPEIDKVVRQDEQVWFQQAEAQLALRNITADDTKYFYVVAALDQETASRLIDFLENPPEQDRYGSIKKQLLSTFDLSQQERAARLLRFPELGDRKPTALMDDMLALLGSHQPCFLFNYIFLQRFPEDIRVALASEDINNPRQLDQKADILWLAK